MASEETENGSESNLIITFPQNTSHKSFCYLAANEKCCVPVVVKRTLFTVRVASLLLYRCFIQYNICYMHNVIAIRCLIQNEALALVLDNK